MALDESENCGLESSRKSDVHDRQAGQLGMKYIGGIIIKDSISSTETPHLEVPMTTRIQNLLAKPTFTISIKDIVAAETLLELFRNPRNFSIPKTSIQTSRNLSHARSDLYLGEASNCSRENLEALENRQQLQAYNFIEVVRDFSTNPGMELETNLEHRALLMERARKRALKKPYR